jgi:hypothetical protein
MKEQSMVDTSITPEQLTRIHACRDRFFAATISTTTDRPKAEVAVAEIVAGKLEKYEVHWCASPAEASALHEKLWGSLGAPIRASLCASFADSFLDSLPEAFNDSLGALIRDPIWGPFHLESFYWGLRWRTLRDSIVLHKAPFSSETKRAFSWVLWASLWVSLKDTEWIACCAFAAAEGLEYEPEQQARIDAFVALTESAFALYVLPGHVILVEKPKAVTCIGGLTSFEWRDSAGQEAS